MPFVVVVAALLMSYCWTVRDQHGSFRLPLSALSLLWVVTCVVLSVTSAPRLMSDVARLRHPTLHENQINPSQWVTFLYEVTAYTTVIVKHWDVYFTCMLQKVSMAVVRPRGRGYVPTERKLLNSVTPVIRLVVTFRAMSR